MNARQTDRHESQRTSRLAAATCGATTRPASWLPTNRAATAQDSVASLVEEGKERYGARLAL
jgi:hypothetical protein